MKCLYILLACFALLSCKKEEVQPQDQNNDLIPPPIPTIDLQGSFEGIIGGAFIEFTENVFGYNGVDSDTLYINSSPMLSEAVYSFSLESTNALSAIEIAHGTVLWDYSDSNKPTLTQFNDFHSTDTLPNFATNGLSGFEVIFKDNSAGIWKSDPTSVNSQSVSFNNVVLESGENGDFAKYNCVFTCYVYNASFTDSLLIDNAVFKGWFKR